MPAACDSLLEDIEDIVSAQDVKPHDRQFARKNVVPKVRKRSSQNSVQADDDPPSDSIIPGAQKIWIRTWGCSHNNSDGEYMAGQLASYGYKITEDCFERAERCILPKALVQTWSTKPLWSWRGRNSSAAEPF